jgi:beta-lactamase regulating signal transducer with metallopeptidase domain
MFATDPYSSLLTGLASFAIRSIFLAVATGCVLALFHVKQTSTRLFAWTAVLYVSLGMPLLSWMLPSLPIRMPLIAQNEAVPAMHSLHTEPAFSRNHAPELDVRDQTAKSSDSFANSPGAEIKHTSERAASDPGALATEALPILSVIDLVSSHWEIVSTAIYTGVAVFLLMRLLVGFVVSRRLAWKSERVFDPRVKDLVDANAQQYAISDIPAICESGRIAVPITLGVVRPSILLPANWRNWSDAKLEAVIAHEMSHVGRGDALTHFLSLLHRAIFWFSPLPWWLERHLANLAEQASDEAALYFGADRNAYARTLLDFFQELQLAPRRVRWQGVSMAKTGQAQQRLERILAWKGSVKMSMKKSMMVAIVALSVPAVYLAAAVRPANQDGNTPVAAQASVQRDDAATAPTAGIQSAVAPAVTAEAPAPPPPAVVADSPASASAASASTAHGQSFAYGSSASSYASQSQSFAYDKGGYSYVNGFDDRERFVIVSGNSDSVTMSGDSDDAQHAKRLKRVIPGDFIWFQNDEKSYVIRDQATIDRARKLWLPQEELGKKQEALGKQQEALGKQQEALGAKMQEVRVNVPDMTAELEKLKAEMKQLTSGATVEEVGRLQSDIGELQSRIGELQSHAGDQQSKIGEQMSALGEQQGKLGQQQGELGRQQGELGRKASREMKQILEEALKNGTAKAEPDLHDGGML